jgi:hypothetical protein
MSVESIRYAMYNNDNLFVSNKSLFLVVVGVILIGERLGEDCLRLVLLPSYRNEVESDDLPERLSLSALTSCPDGIRFRLVCVLEQGFTRLRYSAQIKRCFQQRTYTSLVVFLCSINVNGLRD